MIPYWLSVGARRAAVVVTAAVVVAWRNDPATALPVLIAAVAVAVAGFALES